MNLSKLIAAALAAAVLAPAASRAADKPAPKAKAAQVVELAVTKDGFVPESVTVKHGRPVKLVVTRKVERTCATEIVMKDFGVEKALPLDEPVAVTVTPKKAGDYRYACGMDMVAGVMHVQ
jgi:plastocyanin domain-containing protein